MTSINASTNIPRPELPINLYVSHQSDGSIAAVWDPITAFQIRVHLRLLGDFCGTLPKHIAQNQYLSIPLILSYDEVSFGVARNYFKLIRDEHAVDLHTGTGRSSAADEYWNMRKDEADKQAEEAVRKQREEREKRGVKRRRTEITSSSENVDNEAREEGEDVRPRKALKMGIFRRILQSLGRIAWMFQKREETVQQVNMEMNGRDEEMTNGNNTELVEEKNKDMMLEERIRKQARATALVITATERRRDEEIGKGEEITTLRTPKEVSKKRLGQRQAVFADLHNKGYYMSCGAKFGADFLAYAGDPQLFHAALAIVVMDSQDELEARDVVALGRLGDSTKKRTVLAYIGNQGVRYIGVQWEETLP